VSVANARVSRGFIAETPWAGLAGGPHDDDRDGFGNLCDGKFEESTGVSVAGGDVSSAAGP
jgi:hypothetical protein